MANLLPSLLPNNYMPRLSLGLGVQTTRKVGGGGSPEPTAVLISGAGSGSANGLYSWDGITLINGKPSYIGPESDGFNFSIDWYDVWILSLGGGDSYYLSYNLVNWILGDIGDAPVPTGTLSYS
jgi:hypothetical protein